MRVYISSIPEELGPHQASACDVAHDLGFEPVLRDPAAGRGLDPVRACARQVAAADLVLAIVGWRRGRVPPPELGGDGFHPWSWWETKSAFDHGKPVVVLMAGESWRPQLREQEPRARAVMQDFRGELGRLASLFDDEPADGSTALRGFRELPPADPPPAHVFPDPLPDPSPLDPLSLPSHPPSRARGSPRPPQGTPSQLDSSPTTSWSQRDQ